MSNNPLYTTVIDAGDELAISNGLYIYGTLEDRAHHFKSHNQDSIRYIELAESDDGNSFCVVDGKVPQQFVIKNLQNFEILLQQNEAPTFYLDITGLSHSMWAPILKVLIESGRKFSVIYAEPIDYTKSLSHDSGSIYDLSEKTRGMSPIPGFASLNSDEENFAFVPMLGFEGARFLNMIENVQPVSTYTFPIVGVPGFRLEYPFYTYENNQLALRNTRSWKNILYVPADCPFSAFEALGSIHHEQKNLIKVAPIGTKPHALGAILFKIVNPAIIEIIYDHPIRKKKRTTGHSRRHIYDICGFLEEL